MCSACTLANCFRTSRSSEWHVMFSCVMATEANSLTDVAMVFIACVNTAYVQ